MVFRLGLVGAVKPAIARCEGHSLSRVMQEEEARLTSSSLDPRLYIHHNCFCESCWRSGMGLWRVWWGLRFLLW